MAVDGTRHWSGRSLRLRGGWAIVAILGVRRSGPYERHRYRDRGNCDATADATLLHGESFGLLLLRVGLVPEWSHDERSPILQRQRSRGAFVLRHVSSVGPLDRDFVSDLKAVRLEPASNQ